MSPITIRKLNLNHELMWSYAGHVLERTPTFIRLEARFNRPTTDYGYAVFEENDRFVEHFFADRWYNIFEVHSVQDDHLKGWYCNIGMPAIVGDDFISYVDLALDLWVSANGKQTVLDEDELEELRLDDELKKKVYDGLRELELYFESKNPPL